MSTVAANVGERAGQRRKQIDAAERGFAMPIRVGDPAKWEVIQPAGDWKSMPWTAGKDAFKVATDLYYVEVRILGTNGHPAR